MRWPSLSPSDCPVLDCGGVWICALLAVTSVFPYAESLCSEGVIALILIPLCYHWIGSLWSHLETVFAIVRSVVFAVIRGSL